MPTVYIYEGCGIRASPIRTGMEQSTQHLELSTTIQISSLKILKPWPAEESRLTVTTRPFQLMVSKFNLYFVRGRLCIITITVHYLESGSFQWWFLSIPVLVSWLMTALLTVPKLEPIANTVEEAVVQNRKFTLEQNRTLIRQLW